MDGSHVLPVLVEPDWPRCSTPLPTIKPRSLFLQRDLSDEALQAPIEIQFSREELGAAKQAGYDEGFAAGRAGAAGSMAAAVATALGTIAAAMHDSGQAASRVADSAAEALARTLIRALGSVMPELVRRSALAEAGALIAQVLPGLSREPEIQIAVPGVIADGVTAVLAGLPADFRGRIAVTGRDDMQAGEARISWEAGHASRQPGEVWRAVMATLESALGELAPKEIKNAE
jgi:flagellar biosynthesis/type III secretory pathway protein FliH